MGRGKMGSRMLDLAKEIDELERGRTAMLERVERLRAELKSMAKRTATLKASSEMLGDHVATTAAAVAELQAIEDEARQLGVSVVRMNSDSLGLIFEAESLKETMTEVEDEMERLLSSFIEGRSRKLRGH